jgi:hypothetical protein
MVLDRQKFDGGGRPLRQQMQQAHELHGLFFCSIDSTIYSETDSSTPVLNLIAKQFEEAGTLVCRDFPADTLLGKLVLHRRRSERHGGKNR